VEVLALAHLGDDVFEVLALRGVQLRLLLIERGS